MRNRVAAIAVAATARTTHSSTARHRRTPVGLSACSAASSTPAAAASSGADDALEAVAALLLDEDGVLGPAERFRAAMSCLLTIPPSDMARVRGEGLVPGSSGEDRDTVDRDTVDRDTVDRDDEPLDDFFCGVDGTLVSYGMYGDESTDRYGT